MVEKQTVKEQHIEFADEHRVRIHTVMEEPYRNQDGQPVDEEVGSVERTIREIKTVKEIREAQTFNQSQLADLNLQIRELDKQLENAPLLTERQRQLKADLEAIQANALFDQKKAKREEFIESRRRALQAMRLCGRILKERQEKFPYSSTEPIDQIEIPQDA